MKLKCSHFYLSFCFSSKYNTFQLCYFLFIYFFCLGSGKTNGETDCETSTSVLTQSGLEEINPETKAKIEEEAFNKGWE